LYSISGNQGPEWHITQINLIAAANKDFNILIEGIVGSSYRSDISIDDYQFKERECEPLGDCDFEQDTCKFNIVKNLVINFIIFYF